MKTIRAWIFLICAFLLAFAPASLVSYAEAAVPDLRDTAVLEDLMSSNLSGVPFDLNDYPADAGKDAQLLTLAEFCFSFDKSDTRYGLYAYVYNPSRAVFSESSASNKIQLASMYDLQGEPADYDKFGLEFCNKSDDGLFCKFRVKDPGNVIFDRVSGASRRYDVSGIELIAVGGGNAVEYKAGCSYTYTGYAKGCGPDPAADTLSCKVLELEVLELDVRHTFFRTGLSDKGADHQNQMDSVYFSVSDEILERYGKLQRIKAEWYEYRTREIVVTSNAAFYDAALPYVGQYVDPYRHSKDIGYSLYYDLVNRGAASTAVWAWNRELGVLSTSSCSYLNYLFKVDDIRAYDPYGTYAAVGGVASNKLHEWIYGYDKSYINGRLPVKNGQISADLFLDTVDAGRARGYNVRDFDADIDLLNMLSYESTKKSFWNSWLALGFWGLQFGNLPQLSEDYRDIPPILAVTDEMMSDPNLSTSLLIRQEDMTAFASYRTAAKAAGRTTFLFRFATTDYFAGALTIGRDNFLSPNIYGEAYMAQETVFLDFDIIRLTFSSEGEYHVLPVVHSPFDIIPDITPPVDFPEDVFGWLKTVLYALAALALILLLVFVLVMVPPVWNFVKFVLSIIFFPFVLIYKLIIKASKKGGKK